MDLTIIIPIFNTWKNVYKIIKKLYFQNNLFSFEVILIDDRSLIKPKYIINKIKKLNKNIKIIFLKNNSGPGIARDKGIKKAKGDYIWFVDSDDLLKNEWKKAFEKFRNKKIKTDFIIFQSTIRKKIDESSIEQNNFDVTFNKKISVNTLFQKGFDFEKFNSTIWQFWFNRTFLKKNKIFFGKKTNFEDVTFLSNVFYYSKNCIRIPEICYEHIRKKGSLSSNIKIIRKTSLNFCYDILNSLYVILKLIKISKKKNNVYKFLISRASRNLFGFTSILAIMQNSENMLKKIKIKWRKLSLNLSQQKPTNSKNTNFLDIYYLFLSNSFHILFNYFYNKKILPKKFLIKKGKYAIHCYSFLSIPWVLNIPNKNLKFVGFIDSFENGFTDRITGKKVVSSLGKFKQKPDCILVINRKKKICNNIKKNYIFNGFSKKDIFLLN